MICAAAAVLLINLHLVPPPVAAVMRMHPVVAVMTHHVTVPKNLTEKPNHG